MARDWIGQRLGNYQLVSLLGWGSFAEVYLGEHVRLSNQVAIKILHTHSSEEKIKEFEQEAKTIAKLEHPHIVRVLDFDVSNGIPFLTMDYCPGGSLRQRHSKGECVPLATVVAYTKQREDMFSNFLPTLIVTLAMQQLLSKQYQKQQTFLPLQVKEEMSQKKSLFLLRFTKSEERQTVILESHCKPFLT